LHVTCDAKEYLVSFSPWAFPEGTRYLNQAAFAPLTLKADAARRWWLDAYARNPARVLAETICDDLPALAAKAQTLLGADHGSCFLVRSTIHAMSIAWLAMKRSEPSVIALTDREFPTVRAYWERTAAACGDVVQTVSLPTDFTDDGATAHLENALRSLNASLLVASHVTSWGEVLPIEFVCKAAKSVGTPVCVDASQSFGLLPFDFDSCGTVFYCASAYKWFGAAVGCGVLWTNAPTLVDGGSPHSPGKFLMSDGTCDLSPFTTMSVAADRLAEIGREEHLRVCRALATYANETLAEKFGEELAPEDAFASIASAPLRGLEGESDKAITRFVDELAERHRVATTIRRRNSTPWIRVSCGSYNTQRDVDDLLALLPVP